MEKKNEITIFLKANEKVKKTTINSTTSLLDIRRLFVSLFPKLKYTEETVPELYMEHKPSAVKYHVTDVSDIYRYAIIEAKSSTSHKKVLSHKTRLFSEFFMGRRHEEIVFVMVGLPARGKTFIAQKTARYLSWLGVECKVFNVGNYRRKLLGAHQSLDFFDPENPEGRTKRTYMAVLALDDMFEWLHSGNGRVAIYDATNTTIARRNLIKGRCKDEQAHVIFIESICETPDIIKSNIRETKLHSPDFEDVPPETAIKHFRARIDLYKKAYVPVSDKEIPISYIKLYDVGKKVVVNDLPPGYLVRKVVFFLMNLHITPRPIWLTRHGQSEYNVENRIGGDSKLTPLGEKYAQALAGWVMNQSHDHESIQVWTSTLERSKATARYIAKPKIHLRALDEIDAGRYDSMTYDEIAENHSDEFAARAADKLRYRYPQGESYEDVIQRLEPVIFELERSRTPVMVVAHNAIIRCLYGYFRNKPLAECPYLEVPLHTTFQLTAKAYGTEEKRFELLGKDTPKPEEFRMKVNKLHFYK